MDTDCSRVLDSGDGPSVASFWLKSTRHHPAVPPSPLPATEHYTHSLSLWNKSSIIQYTCLQAALLWHLLILC